MPRSLAARSNTIALVALLALPAALRTQATPAATSRFSIDDALNVVSYSQTDVSDDGRWIATVASTRRDGLGVDYRRDGDPSYIRPSAGTASASSREKSAACV